MSKKLIALILTLCLCASAVCALATSSKEIGDVTGTDDESGVIYVADHTEETQEILDEVAALVADGKPVVEFFDEGTQAQIATALPEGVTADALHLDELFPLASAQELSGSETLKLLTAAEYKDTDAIVVLGGIHDPATGTTTWQVFESYFDEDGKLTVVLPPDFVAAINDGHAMLALLSNVAAA